VLEHGLLIKESETAIENLKLDKPKEGDHVISPPMAKLVAKAGKMEEE